MNAIEVLKDMISYREKGIDEFIELHKTGGESILEIEIRTLKTALLALESVESLKARVVSLSEQKEKLNDLIGQLELESKDFECCLEVLGKIKKELGGEVKK